MLWPPNHDLVNVGLSVTASDNDGMVPTIAVAVFSDEDDHLPAGGGMSPDAKDIAPTTLRLRAEREGGGDGRVYIIRIIATDASNNQSVTYVTVVVPANQSKAAINSVNAQAAAAVVALWAMETIHRPASTSSAMDQWWDRSSNDGKNRPFAVPDKDRTASSSDRVYARVEGSRITRSLSLPVLSYCWLTTRCLE